MHIDCVHHRLCVQGKNAYCTDNWKYAHKRGLNQSVNSLFIQNNCSRFPVFMQRTNANKKYTERMNKPKRAFTYSRESRGLMLNGFTFGNELMSVWHKIRRRIGYKNNNVHPTTNNTKFHFGTKPHWTIVIFFLALFPLSSRKLVVFVRLWSKWC